MMKTGIVFHGTVHQFPTEQIRLPAYFTSNELVADSFCYGKENGRIVKARLSASKVCEIDWNGCSWGGGMFPDDKDIWERYLLFASDGDPEEMDYWKECGCCVDMFADMLRDDGYDLAIFREVREESGCVSDVYVVMNNCRIIPA